MSVALFVCVYVCVHDEASVLTLSLSRAILDQLKWFAGNQIRNVASFGGNIGTASPISDLNPVLISVPC